MNGNEERVYCADKALEGHGLGMVELGRGEANDGPGTLLADLLTDLRHWADQQLIDYAAADRLAEMNHEAETDHNSEEYGGEVAHPREESHG